MNNLSTVFYLLEVELEKLNDLQLTTTATTTTTEEMKDIFAAIASLRKVEKSRAKTQ